MPTHYIQVFLALIVANLLVNGEPFYSNGKQSAYPFFMPQRLVRRNFLRFGKRSAAPDESLAPGEESAGMEEHFSGVSPSNAGVHKSFTRSFLRFGKRRSDNFLRFGKRLPNAESTADTEVPTKDCTTFGDGYFIICRLNESNGSLRYKKARDFLRFG